jgi:1-phosphofructokinase
MRPLVLALNPSVDVEWRVGEVRWEEKNAILTERRWPGGKGVNVARWLKLLGAKPQLLLPLGGRNGEEMAEGLRSERITSRIIPLGEPTRANVIVTTASQGQLRFNPLGPCLSHAEWRAILRTCAEKLKRASILVLSGSLPRGLSATAYAPLIQLAHRAGVKALLDCDGASFASAVRARPFLVKPNQHELAQWAGVNLRSRAAVVRAGERLSKVTGGWVLVSMGAEGGMLVHEGQRQKFFAEPAKVKVRNTVGAGDALLAAVTREISSGSSPKDWLRQGVAAGTALTEGEAGVLPSLDRLRRCVARTKVSG